MRFLTDRMTFIKAYLDSEVLIVQTLMALLVLFSLCSAF